MDDAAARLLLRSPGLLAAVVLVVAVSLAGRPAAAHGHGGGHGGRRSQAIKDANSWRDGFRGPHDFGGGVTIPQDAGLNKGLGGGLDGRGFGAAAGPLDGGGRLDGSDWPLDGGAAQGYRSGRFAGTVDPPGPKAKPQPAKPQPAKPQPAKPQPAKPQPAKNDEPDVRPAFQACSLASRRICCAGTRPDRARGTATS